MQFDIFGDPDPIEAAPAPAPKNERAQITAQHAADIEALPEKLRPHCAPAVTVPTGKAELDEWTRTSQRSYLLYLVGAVARGIYRDSSEANAPYVLMKLNGLGGEW
ncbi:hypothetical protein PQR39_26180 [Paraburkholderia sediminicola]|uniref:hypothetical protein n=1 Tax=Paraburkholderia sediminicola TaxID=458836 RepID=UPI0038BB7D6D